MTERLFETDMSLLIFSATVMRCEPAKGGYAVVLDRTAFFPEGGGQPADHGKLGTANVLDAHRKDGEVLHLCDAPLTVGETVTGIVDAARRLMHSQQHSGEHIFSGLTHRRFGYDNVGFHMGSEAVTMDFNGPMTEAEAREIERQANEIVWQDLPIEVFVPTREELEHIEYRSKKEIDGDVRLVRIEGADCCACCGTHLMRTGAIGQIKLLSIQNYKQGVRVSILCGGRALEYETRMLSALHETAVSLSCREEELPEAVQRLQQERDRLRYENGALAMRLFELESAKERKKAVRVFAADALPASRLHEAASALAEGGICGLALLRKEDGWNFAMTSAAKDVRPATRLLFSRFGGKGGGPKDMTQGRLFSGTVEEIRAELTVAMGQE
ncbi:MAG: alanyl-tRNA editing protein [Clostridiales bacterium]|nr:alanyl-tRNA editing protein [Clostridiales bacterium]